MRSLAKGIKEKVSAAVFPCQKRLDSLNEIRKSGHDRLMCKLDELICNPPKLAGQGYDKDN